MTKPVERPDVAVHGEHSRGVHVHVEGIKHLSDHVVSVGLGEKCCCDQLQGGDILLAVAVVLFHDSVVAGTAYSM